MTQAQADAHLCGSFPEHHPPSFIGQLMAPYAFLKPRCAGKRILDVGFGDGGGAALLAEVAATVVGIDTAPGDIPRALAKYPRPNVAFLQMDATRMTFPDASFDVVCSCQVIEHVPEPSLLQYLREIARVLKPDGLFCVSTLNLANTMKPGKPYQKLIYHEKEFTGSELKGLLAQVFPTVEMSGVYPSWPHRVFRRLKKWGLDRVGPESLNPVVQFYRQASHRDYVVRGGVSRAALDLLALCRKSH